MNKQNYELGDLLRYINFETKQYDTVVIYLSEKYNKKFNAFWAIIYNPKTKEIIKTHFDNIKEYYNNV